jgi:uncharacterized membrane protein YkvI
MTVSVFRRYLLPGFVFQSVVIAGGYGTGREIVEFFLTLGPIRGLLAMVLVTMTVWSLVAAVSYELARRFQTYEYRSFFRRLLGRGWISFELSYAALLLLVLAVIGAAAGSIVEETFGLPYSIGVIGVLLAVGALVFFGSAAIERVMSGWSVVLYIVYAILMVWSFRRFGPQIGEAFAIRPDVWATREWVIGGVRYAAYNLALVPVVLFAVRHIRTRREALSAGLLTGIIGIVPAVLFYTAMAGHYPEILVRPIPANHLLEQLGSRPFQLAFQLVLFGTLIETGTGMIHAVNERLAGAFGERGLALPRLVRPATALILLGCALLLTRFGLVDLIAKGYGTLTWFFLAIYVIPVLTIGIWKLARVPDWAASFDAPYDGGADEPS